MSLIYNYGQRNITIPNVLSRVYKYSRMMQIYTVRFNESVVTFDTGIKIGAAWKYIENHCAKNKECNKYFATLRKEMTLSDILSTVNFTVHLLAPKEGHTENELPLANSAGSDFALSLSAFFEAKCTEALAATILHEIAHFAGATTNNRDLNALQAEKALIPCGLRQYYNEEAKG